LLTNFDEFLAGRHVWTVLISVVIRITMRIQEFLKGILPLCGNTGDDRLYWRRIQQLRRRFAPTDCFFCSLLNKRLSVISYFYYNKNV